MSDIAPSERLQPSLLDRLTDDDPGNRREALERNLISASRLRAIILRDLGWLFGTGNLATLQDLSDWPEAARSVINYGVPDLSGLAIATLNPDSLAAAMRQAILEFEPRILARTLRVQANVDRAAMGGGALEFRIEGLLWSQPAPIGLSLKTEVDLESLRVVVTEQSR